MYVTASLAEWSLLCDYWARGFDAQVGQMLARSLELSPEWGTRFITYVKFSIKDFVKYLKNGFPNTRILSVAASATGRQWVSGSTPVSGKKNAGLFSEFRFFFSSSTELVIVPSICQ
ncbi:hypothetical protein SFRURICE_006932 [Spodoptera frugiperda]|nr:hypothetical protein SFRURICE_006932 [Spodoptera frugiperda]